MRSYIPEYCALISTLKCPHSCLFYKPLNVYVLGINAKWGGLRINAYRGGVKMMVVL